MIDYKMLIIRVVGKGVVVMLKKLGWNDRNYDSKNCVRESEYYTGRNSS